MRLKLSTKQEVMCHINGEKHQLRKFSTVLIYGKNVADLPGLRYRAIRSSSPSYDFRPIYNRRTARSKYGARNVKRLHKFRKTRGKGEAIYN
jgi:small subunit ribosomal protein S12